MQWFTSNNQGQCFGTKRLILFQHNFYYSQNMDILYMPIKKVKCPAEDLKTLDMISNVSESFPQTLLLSSLLNPE